MWVEGQEEAEARKLGALDRSGHSIHLGNFPASSASSLSPLSTANKTQAHWPFPRAEYKRHSQDGPRWVETHPPRHSREAAGWTALHHWTSKPLTASPAAQWQFILLPSGQALREPKGACESGLKHRGGDSKVQHIQSHHRTPKSAIHHIGSPAPQLLKPPDLAPRRKEPGIPHSHSIGESCF